MLSELNFLVAKANRNLLSYMIFIIHAMKTHLLLRKAFPSRPEVSKDVLIQVALREAAIFLQQMEKDVS